MSAGTNLGTRLDESLMQAAIPTGLTGVLMLVNSIQTGTPEVKSLLTNECDVIIECKICRNLFRSLPSFVVHKRSYCRYSAVEYRRQTFLSFNKSKTNSSASLEKCQEDSDAAALELERPSSTESCPSFGSDSNSNDAKRSDQIGLNLNNNNGTVRNANSTATKQTLNFLNRLTKRIDASLSECTSGSASASIIHLHNLPVVEKLMPYTRFENGVQIIQNRQILPELAKKESKGDEESSSTITMVLPQDAANRVHGMSLRTRRQADASVTVKEISRDQQELYERLTSKTNAKRCDVSNFQCGECKKVFKSLDTLAYHLTCFHVESEPSSYTCLLCGEDFDNVYSFTTHSRMLHKDVVKRHGEEVSRGNSKPIGNNSETTVNSVLNEDHADAASSDSVTVEHSNNEKPNHSCNNSDIESNGAVQTPSAASKPTVDSGTFVAAVSATPSSNMVKLRNTVFQIPKLNPSTTVTRRSASSSVSTTPKAAAISSSNTRKKAASAPSLRKLAVAAKNADKKQTPKLLAQGKKVAKKLRYLAERGTKKKPGTKRLENDTETTNQGSIENGCAKSSPTLSEDGNVTEEKPLAKAPKQETAPRPMTMRKRTFKSPYNNSEFVNMWPKRGNNNGQADSSKVEQEGQNVNEDQTAEAAGGKSSTDRKTSTSSSTSTSTSAASSVSNTPSRSAAAMKASKMNRGMSSLDQATKWDKYPVMFTESQRAKLAQMICNETLTCLQCQTKFRNLLNCERHCYTHLRYVRFKCAACDTAAFYRTDLRRHMKTQCPGIRSSVISVGDMNRLIVPVCAEKPGSVVEWTPADGAIDETSPKKCLVTKNAKKRRCKAVPTPSTVGVKKQIECKDGNPIPAKKPHLEDAKEPTGSVQTSPQDSTAVDSESEALEDARFQSLIKTMVQMTAAKVKARATFDQLDVKSPEPSSNDEKKQDDCVKSS